MNRKLARNFLALVSSALSFGSAARAEDLTFFEQGINYWHAPVAEKASVSAKPTAKAEASVSQPFDWHKYLNSERNEFFKEGDYTPPEPFMEVARRPTDENLARWFEYVEMKNALAQRLGARMEDFVKQHGGSMQANQVSAQSHPPIPQPVRETGKDSQLHVRMYFDSTCPHCRKMFGTLAELQERGYLVDARQVDNGPLIGIPPGIAVHQASPEELKIWDIKSVPVVLINDGRRKKIFRQVGYAGADEIIQKLGQG